MIGKIFAKHVRLGEQERVVIEKCSFRKPIDSLKFYIVGFFKLLIKNGKRQPVVFLISD